MYTTSPRERASSALAAAAIVGLGGAALVWGLASDVPFGQRISETLVALTPVTTETPPPPPRPRPMPSPTHEQAKKAQASRAKDAASPENLRNQASAIFAPILPPLRTPPPIVAAPAPGIGNAANTGASDRIGPGRGAGGVGDGTGGGGNGLGGDGDDDTTTRPIQTRGKLYWSDLPEDLRRSHAGGELELTYRVEVDGHVSNCRVTRSSGSPSLDVRTCQLITKRFRFKPSYDASGRPVASYIVETHGWDRNPEDDPDWQNAD